MSELVMVKQEVVDEVAAAEVVADEVVAGEVVEDAASSALYAVHYPDGRAAFFDTWAAAKAAVRGSGGARHKKFADRAAADAWIAAAARATPPADCCGPRAVLPAVDADAAGAVVGAGGAASASDVVYVYVDGSYAGGKAGWGWVAVDGAGQVVAEARGRLAAAPSRNIDGELAAATGALAWWALQGGAWARVVVCHDYLGIREWAAGSWAAKSATAVQYVAVLDQLGVRAHIGNGVFFRHVKGHSGDRWNDWADALAGQAAAGNWSQEA